MKTKACQNATCMLFQNNSKKSETFSCFWSVRALTNSQCRQMFHRPSKSNLAACRQEIQCLRRSNSRLVRCGEKMSRTLYLQPNGDDRVKGARGMYKLMRI
jgi:hypothetical protein